MKEFTSTVTLTDKQFDTLFDYVDNKVTTIVNASVDYQDYELQEQDALRIIGALEAQAKQPKAEW